MKFATTLLIASFALAQNTLTAQSAAPARPHLAAHAAAAGHGCIKLPVLSPKIPALPAGAPCAKSLYTIVSNPSIKLTDVAPFENPDLAESLGIPLPNTITLGYVDIKTGTGALAAPHKWYSMKYHGYLVDGTEFDSSDKHPELGPAFIFQQGPQGPQGRRGVIVGWDTGLDGMRIGGKRRLFIPYQLAYGPSGNAGIPPKAMLIFDVEFIAQNDSDPTPMPAAAPSAPAASVPGQAGGPPAIQRNVQPKPAAPAASQPPASPAPSSSTPAVRPQ